MCVDNIFNRIVIEIKVNKFSKGEGKVLGQDVGGYHHCHRYRCAIDNRAVQGSVVVVVVDDDGLQPLNRPAEFHPIIYRHCRSLSGAT